MNIGALPELLVSWLKNQGAELLQPGKTQPGAFQSGQQYEGKVLENLPGGRSLVRVNQQLLDMPLPQQAKPGDTVRLTFLNATTRPTFLLQSAPVGNAPPVRLSEAVQQVNALVRFAQAPATAVPSQSGAAVPGQAVATAPGKVIQEAVVTHLGRVSAPAPAVQPGATPAVQASVALAATSPSTVSSLSQGATQAAVLSVGSAKAPASTAAPTAAPKVAIAPSSVVQAAATQPAAVQAGAKPIMANPSVMLAPPAATAPSLASSPAIPAMAMTGQAVDGLRAALASNTALTTQGVVTQTSPGVQMLSQLLHKTLAESGMFYENHLGRWVRGQLPLEAIQREPQAMLRELPGQLLKLPGLEGMPEEAARLAGRQLMLLEGGPFLWQGLAWPGQWMQWLVEEGPGDGHNPEDELPRWRTQLRLTLPRLGEVTAELGVGARGLEIRLAAPNAETLDEMQAGLPELAERMRAADLKLTGLRVELATDGQE